MGRSGTGRNKGEPTGRNALAMRMSAQFDRALAEAAEAMDLLGGWDEPDPQADDGAHDNFLPLEFQLADLERAVDTMMQERERFIETAVRHRAEADASGDES